MRILFVADGRSPIARNWISYFIQRGDEIHLASTFPCEPYPGLSSFHTLNIAFSGSASGAQASSVRGLLPTGLRTWLRQWLGPLSLGRAAEQLRQIATEHEPELVHAMRIPYEGMAAAKAGLTAPLLISVWGNDFTLHARANPLMASRTRKAVCRADALHTDTQRDKKLALEWGLDLVDPVIVLPGNGGIRREIFYPPKQAAQQPQVIYPRGLRAYVRADTFFRAIPLILEELPESRFVCPNLEGETEAETWLRKLSIAERVNLLPAQSPQQMAELYRASQVMLSPSTHDGTPNTLLEAMACGCFPVAGDIESLHEWISPGENGLLVDPADPHALANAALRALKDTDLRRSAADKNERLIEEKAEYMTSMARAADFYMEVSALK